MDEARFEQAGRKAVEIIGFHISVGEYERGIAELAESSVTMWPVKDQAGKVREFAHRAVMLSTKASSRSH